MDLQEFLRKIFQYFKQHKILLVLAAAINVISIAGLIVGLSLGNDDACEHEFQRVEYVSATCEDNGYEVVKCSHCDEEKTETLTALGHNYVISSETLATCTEGGSKTFDCSRCTDSYVETGDELGHDYKMVEEKPATCTEDGKKVFNCTRCVDAYKETIKSPGHDYVVVQDVKATCEEDSKTVYRCKTCGDEHSETVQKALGHDYKLITEIPATCTERSVKVYSCSTCGGASTERDAALGHAYEVIEEIAPTCIEEGKKELFCDRCQQYDVETIQPLGHEWSTLETQQPTCLVAGSALNVCGRCYEEESVSISPLGHKYQEVSNVSPTCQNTGLITYACKNDGCEEEYLDVLEKVPHLPVKKATIYEKCLCAECGSVLQEEIDHDLAINYYNGFVTDYFITEVNSQDNSGYDLGNVNYYADKTGTNPIPFNEKFAFQNFYKHSILSTKKISTTNGKNYVVDSGFKVSFLFNNLDAKIGDFDVKNSDFLTMFDEQAYNMGLVRVVQEKTCTNAIYKIYEVVDFSSSYLEISKKVNGRYEPLTKISSMEEWEIVLREQEFILSDKNNLPFFSSGDYRILIKSNVSWFLTSISGDIYDAQGNECYPYGFVNDQYDYFYVTVTEETYNVLKPDDTDESKDFFYQINIDNVVDGGPFVNSGDRLQIGDKLTLCVDAKLGYLTSGAFYEGRQMESWTLTVSKYDVASDAYLPSQEFDLLEVMEGNFAIIDVAKDSWTTGYCKIEVAYVFKDLVTGQETATTDAYYLDIA